MLINCDHCGQEADKPTGSVNRSRKNGNNLYCSKECSGAGRKRGRLPRGTVQSVGSLQKWRCAICRVSLKKQYHVDHIMPLARGGKHEPANIQLLCPTCNVRKAAKDPIEYMQSLGRLL